MKDPLETAAWTVVERRNEGPISIRLSPYLQRPFDPHDRHAVARSRERDITIDPFPFFPPVARRFNLSASSPWPSNLAADIPPDKIMYRTATRSPNDRPTVACRFEPRNLAIERNDRSGQKRPRRITACARE